MSFYPTNVWNSTFGPSPVSTLVNPFSGFTNPNNSSIPFPGQFVPTPWNTPWTTPQAFVPCTSPVGTFPTTYPTNAYPVNTTYPVGGYTPGNNYPVNSYPVNTGYTGGTSYPVGGTYPISGAYTNNPGTFPFAYGQSPLSGHGDHRVQGCNIGLAREAA